MAAAPITVGDLLSDLPGARVVAGEAGLQRAVRSVNVLELPTELDRLRQGDLLFAAAPRPGLHLVGRLLPELNRRGLAGVALRPHLGGGGAERLPDEARSSADKLSFPVLELHPESSYSDLLLPLMARLLDHQARLLQRQTEIHRTIMRTVLEGKGLAQAVAAVAMLVDNPVVVSDALERPLAASPWEGDTAGGWARAPAVEGEYLMGVGDTLHRRERFRWRDGVCSRVVTPVVVAGETQGHIAVAEVHRTMTEDDLTAVGAATAVVALEIANQRALTDVERRYRNEFLDALLAGALEEAPALERARLFGWDLTPPAIVLVLDVDSAPARGQPDRPDDGGVRLARDLLLSEAAGAVEGAIVGRAAGLVVVILHPPGAESKTRPTAEAVVQSLRSRVQRLGRHLVLTAGIGDCHAGVAGLRRSFQEARRALQIGRRVWGPGCAAHVADLGVHQLLAAMRNSDELTRLLARLEPLVRYDQEHRTDLVQTLDLYFECRGNVRRVSERLYAHYNTVLYRLERIQQIIGADLEDPLERLNLQVALQAFKLQGMV